MTTASGGTAPVAVSASAARRRRATVTRPSVKIHHDGHHRRGLRRSHAAAPATATASKAVTREECYAFVRSGCKPKESFRYDERCDARCDGSGCDGVGDARRRHVDSFQGFGLDLAWLRDGRRLKPEPWMRGVHGGNARVNRSFIYIYSCECL